MCLVIVLLILSSSENGEAHCQALWGIDLFCVPLLSSPPPPILFVENRFQPWRPSLSTKGGFIQHPWPSLSSKGQIQLLIREGRGCWDKGERIEQLWGRGPCSSSRNIFNAELYLWAPLQELRRRQWQPIPVLLPGKSHGWRSLVGCSPWGR